MKQKDLKRALDGIAPPEGMEQRIKAAVQKAEADCKSADSAPRRPGIARWKRWTAAAACLMVIGAGGLWAAWDPLFSSASLQQQDTAAGQADQGAGASIEPETAGEQETEDSRQYAQSQQKAAGEQAAQDTAENHAADTAGAPNALAASGQQALFWMGEAVESEDGTVLSLKLVQSAASFEVEAPEQVLIPLQGESWESQLQPGSRCLVSLSAESGDAVWDGRPPILLDEDGTCRFDQEAYPELSGIGELQSDGWYLASTESVTQLLMG